MHDGIQAIIYIRTRQCFDIRVCKMCFLFLQDILQIYYHNVINTLPLIVKSPLAIYIHTFQIVKQIMKCICNA